MSFFDHFEELRLRLLRCLAVFFMGFVGFYFLSEPLLYFLRKPLFEILPADQQKLYFTHLFENFLTHLKIGGYASIFFLSPYYFYEIWAFIEPGLYPHERKWVVPFVLATTFFFLAGGAFAYFILFPVGFKFFIQYGVTTDIPLLTIDSYYSTCLKLLLLFGLAFELPVIICLLGLMGVIDAQFLRAHRRNAILLISIVAALFAPPDAISMLILGIPLIFLYEAAILVVQFFSSKTKSDDGSEENLPHPLEGRSK